MEQESSVVLTDNFEEVTLTNNYDEVVILYQVEITVGYPYTYPMTLS